MQVPIADANDDKPRSNTLRFGLNVVIALTLAVIWFFSFVHHKRVFGNGNTYLGRLRDEFQKVAPPQETLALDTLKVHAKGPSALVENRYSTRLPVTTVFDHYKKQLSSNGWVYSGRLSVGSATWIDTYCKGEFAASLQSMPSDSSGTSLYSFSISWSEVSIHECSPKT